MLADTIFFIRRQTVLKNDDEDERGYRNKDELNDVLKKRAKRKMSEFENIKCNHDMIYDVSFAGFLMKRGKPVHQILFHLFCLPIFFSPHFLWFIILFIFSSLPLLSTCYFKWFSIVLFVFFPFLFTSSSVVLFSVSSIAKYPSFPLTPFILLLKTS